MTMRIAPLGGDAVSIDSVVEQGRHSKDTS